MGLLYIQVIHKCGSGPRNTTWRFVCDLRAAGFRPADYMVAPIHTDWPAILATEMTTVTSASLAARDASTAPFEQTASMQ